METEIYSDLSDASYFIRNIIKCNYNQSNKDQIISLVDEDIKIKYLKKSLKLAKEIESILPNYFNPTLKTYEVIKNTFDEILLKNSSLFEKAKLIYYSTTVETIPEIDMLGIYFLNLFLEAFNEKIYQYIKGKFNAETDLKEFAKLSHKLMILDNFEPIKQYSI